MCRRMFQLLFIMALGLGAGAEPPTKAEIVGLVSANLKATEAKDLDALLDTLHSDSLARPDMADVLEAFASYRLKFEAPTIEFVSMAGEYALVRVVQRTIRVAGPDFLDNEIDGIWALRREGSRWKYWSQMLLGMKPLAQQQGGRGEP